MRFYIFFLVMLAFTVLEVFIGGSRTLYAIPGVCLIGLAGIFSAFPRMKNTPRVTPFALLSAFLFTAYILLRNRMSEVDYIGRLQFFIAAGCLIIYLLFSLVLTRSSERKWFFYGLMALAIVQVGVGAVQFTQNNQWMPLPWAQRLDHTWRATGLFISPNNYAGYLEIIALMGASMFVWGRIPMIQRLLVGYVTLCCVAGIAFSGSRGGYVSFAIGCCTMLFLTLIAMKRTRPGRFPMVAPIAAISGVILVGGVLLVMLQSPTLRDRVAQINDPSNMRLLLWSSALDQFHLSPIFGTGGFSFLYFGRLFRHPSVQNDPIHTHNDYVQLLADYGAVGIFLFAVLLIAHLVAGGLLFQRLVHHAETFCEHRSNNLALCIGGLSVIAAYISHSVVDFNMQLPANALIIAVIFAILGNTNTSGNEKIRNPRLISFTTWLLPPISLAVLVYGLTMFPGDYFAERARFALFRQEKPAAALEFARQGLAIDRKNPDLYFYFGEASLEMAAGNIGGNPLALRNNAVHSFSKGLEIFPYDSRLAVKLAQAYSESGDYFNASNAISLAEKWDPNSSFVCFFRGLVEQGGGYDQEAETSYNEAIHLGGEGGALANIYLACLQKLEIQKATLASPPAPIPAESPTLP